MNGLNKSSISSQSSDGLISEQNSVHGELEVDGVPLEVVKLLDVDGSMHDRLTDVEEEESWHEWEHDSDPVPGETNVDHTISFEG